MTAAVAASGSYSAIDAATASAVFDDAAVVLRVHPTFCRRITAAASAAVTAADVAVAVNASSLSFFLFCCFCFYFC